MAHLGVVHVNGDTTGDFQTLLGMLVTDGVMDHHFAFTLLQKRTQQEMTEQDSAAQALWIGCYAAAKSNTIYVSGNDDATSDAEWQ